MIVFNNQNATISGEDEIIIGPPYDDLDGTQLIRFEVISGGPIQFSVGPNAVPSDARAYAVGDKTFITIENKKFNLRAKGSGVVNFIW